MKPIIVSVLIAGVLISGAIVFSGNAGRTTDTPSIENVSMVEGKQVVSIIAKGGYSPSVSKAKADTPTTLRVTTRGTFDCSSTLTIPSLGYEKSLPPSGVTEINIPPQKAGSIIEGLCSMGMYTFEILFE